MLLVKVGKESWVDPDEIVAVDVNGSVVIHLRGGGMVHPKGVTVDEVDQILRDAVAVLRA